MKIQILIILLPVVTSAQLDLNSIRPCNVGCQDGWVPYSGNCYKKMFNVLTQSTAEQECLNLGSHLASFETTEEATAIRSLVLIAPLFSTNLLSYSSTSQDSWIGLSKTSNGAWKWTDSSEVEFTNLPDGTSVTGASCVSMNISGVWQPNECSSTVSSFICKRASASSA
ncbi:hypothetical protein CAEBREN_28656 [Caenorhabditis brenneri]|uniref:C-type lectin domain-containing protein n=1 Tax=Caenorhabditis brenneri TaxID=135651 RepID=G0PLV0_CAEBE|nr:hypothetical protein CAEBREN_28656 [Caenorhabditis brenneri]